MSTIKLATTATPVMAAVLPRAVSPLDIARRAGCLALAVMRPDLMTYDAATGAVSAVANLANAARPFVQATGANQPALADDAALGRQTLLFNPDRARFLDLTGPVAYTGAFSMLTVYRSPVEADSHDAIVGAYGSTDATQAALVQRSTSKLQGPYYDATPQQDIIAPDAWAVAVMCYDGTNLVRTRLNGSATASATATGEPTATAFRIGHNSAALGLRGRVDLAALFSVDLLASANAALWADVRTMLARFYGSAVPALAA